MGKGGCHLTKVERVSDHEMMNAVCAAKIEAKQLEWPQPPMVHDLGLLQGIAWRYIAIIMNIGTDKEQAELTYDIWRYDDNHRAIDHVHQH